MVLPLYGPLWYHTHPLAEEIIAAVLDLLVPFYTYDATLDGPVDRSARLMTLLLKRGLARVYFPEPDNLLLIYYSPAQEETWKQAFEAEGLKINMVPGS